MKNNLVLSVFPGIDLLGMAFEEQGYCVVRGPDLLWGGNIKTFHPPANVFEGVIGGPPCPEFSPLRYLITAHGYKTKHGNLIPEFERCVAEASPDWVLMEEGPLAPDFQIPGYKSFGFFINPLWLGEEQSRKRKICFAIRGEQAVDIREFIEYAALEVPIPQPAVTHDPDPYPVKQNPGGKLKVRQAPVLTSGQPTYSEDGKVKKALRRSWEECCRLQGLPGDFLSDSPFTLTGKRQTLGNGVPLQMGRAIAKAIREATK